MSEPKKLTEEERLATLLRWDNTPSPNPRYKGATPGDLAHALFRVRPKPKG